VHQKESSSITLNQALQPAAHEPTVLVDKWKIADSSYLQLLMDHCIIKWAKDVSVVHALKRLFIPSLNIPLK
jgi:hypothetical protein